MFSGLSLLYPLALLSALAIAIPLAIHLFNRAKPKTLLFGSVHLIPRTAQQPINQLHLQQRRLLAVRIGLIALLALFLAQVLNHNPAKHVTPKPIVLVTHDWLVNASTQDKQALAKVIESQQSYVLARELQPLAVDDMQSGATFEQVSPQQNINLWAMLALHLNRWPPEQQWQVYTTDHARQFVGAKTPLYDNISWHVLQYPKTDSVKTFETDSPMSVTLVYDDDSQDALQHWQGALSILMENGFHSLSYQAISANQTPEEDSQSWVVSLTQSGSLSLLPEPALSAIKARAQEPEFVLTLAQTLLNLSQQQEKRITGHLDPQQIAALVKPKDEAMASVALANTPNWWPWLVLMIVIMFFLERWLSEASISMKKDIEDK